ncbi:hypothetical protein ACOSP7_003984 [Xanthoceras sorbifolium]
MYAGTQFLLLLITILLNCKNHILNCLDDTLYDVYSNCKIAKDLWDSLEKKYMVEDADLILRFRVEDVHRKDEKNEVTSVQVNNAEERMSKPKNQFQLLLGVWKVGHKVQECRHKKNFNFAQSSNKNQTNSQANIMEIKDDLVAVVSETNMVTNTKCLWIDTGATKHTCVDRNMFSDYQEINNEGKLYIGNDSAANVIGKSKVLLKFTSRKVLTLDMQTVVLLIDFLL